MSIDFNAEESEPYISQLFYKCNAKKIFKEKNALNPSCVDIFKTNGHFSFQNTIPVCDGLSDFHKMVITVIIVKIYY